MTPRDARATSAAQISVIGRRATSFAEAALAPRKVRAAEEEDGEEEEESEESE